MNTFEQILEWSAPTQRGGFVVRTAEPNQIFWGLWRKDRESLKRDGISVKPGVDRDWVVEHWARAGITTDERTESAATYDEETAYIESRQPGWREEQTPSNEVLFRSPEGIKIVTPPGAVVWSDEQGNIFTWFRSGTGNLIVLARAGTGKTTTIKQAFTYAPEEEMLYAVFNTKNKLEAEAKIKDPRVEVKTLHGLGYFFIKHFWPDAAPDDKVETSRCRAAATRLIREEQENPTLTPDIEFDVVNAIGRLVGFAKNTSVNPSWDFLVSLANAKDISGPGDWTTERVAKCALYAIELSLEPDEQNRISFNDMVWLPIAKGWVSPIYDLVVVDEAQDMNLLQLTMARGACREGGRIVVVGDDRQCVIDGTHISCNSEVMTAQHVKRGDLVLSGVGAGTSRQTTAEDVTHRQVYDHPVITVKTESGKTLTTTPEHLYFAGFLHNEKTQYFTYLMFREDYGFRIGTTQKNSSQKNNRDGLSFGFQVRLNQEAADCMWFLHTSDTEQEARYYEQLYSLTYGIPTWIWNTTGRSVKYGNRELVKLFQQIDTTANAKRLLNALGMFIERPHYIPKCCRSRANARLNFSITLCADNRGASPLHSYTISGSRTADANILRQIGITPRKAKGVSSWRYESVTANLGDLYSTLDKIKQVLPLNIIEKARLNRKALPFTPASHVLPGMSVFIVGDDGKIIYDTVVSTTPSLYTGGLHDLNVARTHNYAANGILVHNCIYGFRGADTSGMERMQKELKAATLGLTTTYRCPKAVVALAQAIVPDYKAADSAPEGLVEYCEVADIYDRARPGDAILSRANAPLVPLCLGLLRNGVPARMEGRDVAKQLTAMVLKFKAKSVPDFLKKLDAWATKRINRLKIQTNSGPQITLVEDQRDTLAALADGCPNVAAITSRLRSLFDDSDKTSRPAVVLSSVHKAKGLEWDRVTILAGTFNRKKKSDLEQQEESNIYYVAMTRTKKVLTFATDNR